MVLSIHPAACPPLLQNGKQLLTVEAVGDGWQYCTLPAAIGHGKRWRDLTIQSYIGCLVHIYEDKQSNEDHWEASSDHFPEKKAMKSQVKSLGHVHGTCEHLWAILHVPVHSLYHSPGAHGGGTTSLIGKLKVIEAKLDSKQKNENPVNQFQQNAADGNAAVILADIVASKLVLDDWY